MITDEDSQRIYNELVEQIYPIIGAQGVRVDVLLDVLAHLVAAAITVVPAIAQEMYQAFQTELAKEINAAQSERPPDAGLQ